MEQCARVILLVLYTCEIQSESVIETAAGLAMLTEHQAWLLVLGKDYSHFFRPDGRQHHARRERA